MGRRRAKRRERRVMTTAGPGQSGHDSRGVCAADAGRAGANDAETRVASRVRGERAGRGGPQQQQQQQRRVSTPPDGRDPGSARTEGAAARGGEGGGRARAEPGWRREEVGGEEGRPLGRRWSFFRGPGVVGAGPGRRSRAPRGRSVRAAAAPAPRAPLFWPSGPRTRERTAGQGSGGGAVAGCSETSGWAGAVRKFGRVGPLRIPWGRDGRRRRRRLTR
jgi:hypothetical protein